MPVASNTVSVFDGDVKDRPPQPYPLHSHVYGIYNSLRMRPWQFAAITSVELTLQQNNLEGGALERCSRNLGVQARENGCQFEGTLNGEYPKTRQLTEDEREMFRTVPRMPFLGSTLSLERICIGAPITHLTIRLNRTDWWTWTDHPEAHDVKKKLRLEPMINHTQPPHNDMAMDQGREARRKGAEPEFPLDNFEKDGRWGPQIAEFWPNLQTLELVFETFRAKEAQLDDVISAAKLWKFPMQGNAVLECSGDPTLLHWQGAGHYGYEHEAPWVLRPPTTLPQTLQASKWSLWSRVTGADARGQPQDDHGQHFLVRSLMFERRVISSRRQEGE
ncbi:MAG: hypothetical protein Q9162_000288 [Coniocarpon cinnabarinum]